MNLPVLSTARLRWLRVLVAAGGAGAILLAGGVELLGLGAVGLGALQLILATAGFAALLLCGPWSGPAE